MKRHILAAIVLPALIAGSALAQPSAQQIIDRAQEAYASMMSDVESYLVTTDMFGMEHQMYFERIEGASPLDYRASVRTTAHGEWTTTDDDGPAGASIPTSDMFERLRAEARLVGEQTLDGRRAYALSVDDPSTVFEPGDLPTDDEFELETMTLFVAADNHMLIGFDGEGSMQQDGRTIPVTVEMRMSDFRTVGPMTHPFVTAMRLGGFEDAFSEDERRQLEEARRQLEQLPPEQRRMMEQMMGDQLAQIEAMFEGEGVEMEMRVTDLQVNVPRPE